VRLSASSARSLAGAFLGEDEESLGEAQIAQVVCELANMLCGWIVSRTESRGVWELGSPELVGGDDEEPERIQQSFGVEHGVLTVSLCLGVPA
jgi:CheY-specific phosphatase CheX